MTLRINENAVRPMRGYGLDAGHLLNGMHELDTYSYRDNTVNCPGRRKGVSIDN